MTTRDNNPISSPKNASKRTHEPTFPPGLDVSAAKKAAKNRVKKEKEKSRKEMSSRNSKTSSCQTTQQDQKKGNQQAGPSTGSFHSPGNFSICYNNKFNITNIIFNV